MATRARLAAAGTGLCALWLFVGCHAASEEPDGEAPTEITVQVGKVVRATLHRYVSSYGRVAPKPASAGASGGVAALATSEPGIVREVAMAEGQAVHPGDLVVRLEDRVAKTEVSRARAGVRFAEQALEREQALWKDQNTSQRRLQEAEQALAQANADLAAAHGRLAQVQLRSPLEGVVSRIHVAPGQAVDPNTVIAEIVDVGELVVLAQVPAEDAASVAVGQAARVRARGSVAPVSATVSFKSPAVDPGTGAVLVRLALASDAPLQPGRFVEVRIVVEERADRLAVPVASVHTFTNGESVLSVVSDGIAHRQRVHTGLREGDLVEVEGDGLEEGTTVVTVGSYALPEETRVRVVPPSEPDPAADE